jgi:hypothetical protein
MPYNTGPGLKISTCQGTPAYAPAGFRDLPDAFKTNLDDGEETRGCGSGRPVNLLCEACGAGGADAPEGGKAKLIFSYSCMQRNGNYSTRKEVECVKCGVFSTIETWEEG